MKLPLLRLLFALVVASSLTNCTTAYDAYGQPQQVVTPEGALLGAAAVGLLAFALASDDDGYEDCDYRPARGYSRRRHDCGY